MAARGQLLIETDVLAEYLTALPGEKTLLREALKTTVCYTTMLNAMELFRAASTTEQRASVLQMLYVVRVLGFNARYAEPFAEFGEQIEHETGNVLTDREALVLGMARASKLAVLTRSFFDRYSTFKIVPVFNHVPLETELASLGASNAFESKQSVSDTKTPSAISFREASRLATGGRIGDDVLEGEELRVQHTFA
jgi:hypothetical protein